MSNRSVETLWLLARLAAENRQQRFYTLRFMWTAIASFEKLGLPADALDELRGIYTGMADGVLFKDFINQKKEVGSEDTQPQS
ncbi:hypothetical protein N836_35085 [Leptolyngbya sp. Heron Island J]|uniref:hypothetical protein n=1 Tax=Leptolyngbya sp. Heron Island J TaxID=1385935 RepID=UPI0003B9964A|nr:hypothetical protein [Leptolyngbya sp. Heron Island J]ESA37846.1 hypothetical protein N836_35085 [Leptolyngbya sp. Heron Island J]